MKTADFSEKKGNFDSEKKKKICSDDTNAGGHDYL